MKVKSLMMFLVFSLMLIMLSGCVFAYEDVGSFKNNNITYELFNDGTAKIVTIEEDLLNVQFSMYDSILYNNEEYKVTSIGENVLNSITQNQEIYMYFDVAPKLEPNNSFDNISAIYIPLGAQGYTKEAGWPIEKLKQYKINIQPQDMVVTAGEIKDTDTLHASAGLAVSGGSILYRWYYCDKDGNITDNTPISYYADLQLSKDLTYDNDNNNKKDHYFVCVIGMDGEILEKTRVVKVTVNPGAYKVTFNTQWLLGDSTDSIKVSVNDERKLTTKDIPTIEKLKISEKGFVFLGWSIDQKNIIDPLKITFNKNTTVYPIWQMKVTFESNGGEFSDGKDSYSITTTNNSFEFYEMFEKMPEIKRDGYEFLGFFDEEKDGKALNYYMAEDGINEPVTFYAHWKDLSSDENYENNVNEDISNPPTGDSMLLIVGVLLIAGISILTTVRFSKNHK